MLAQERRFRVHQRHRVLQLVAEPKAPPDWYEPLRAHRRQATVWYMSHPLASTSTAASGVITCTAPSVRFHCARTASSAACEAAAPR